jgi:hypothetical protein
MQVVKNNIWNTFAQLWFQAKVLLVWSIFLQAKVVSALDGLRSLSGPGKNADVSQDFFTQLCCLGLMWKDDGLPAECWSFGKVKASESIDSQI